MMETSRHAGEHLYRSPQSASETAHPTKRSLAEVNHLDNDELGVSGVPNKMPKGRQLVSEPRASFPDMNRTTRIKQSEKLEMELPTTLAGYKLSGPPTDFDDNQCYCNSPRNFAVPEFLCRQCFKWFHQGCTGQNGQDWMVPFMINYSFVCAFCSEAGREEFELKPGKYLQFCVTAVANLRHSSLLAGNPRELFAGTKEVVPFITAHWKAVSGGLPEKGSNHTWHNSVCREMVRNPAVFHVVRPDVEDQQPHRSLRTSPKFALVSRDPRIIRPAYTGWRSRPHYGDFLQSEVRLLSLLELPLPEPYKILTTQLYQPFVSRNRSWKPAYRVARIPDPPQNQALGQEEGVHTGVPGQLLQVATEPLGTEDPSEVESCEPGQASGQEEGDHDVGFPEQLLPVKIEPGTEDPSEVGQL